MIENFLTMKEIREYENIQIIIIYTRSDLICLIVVVLKTAEVQLTIDNFFMIKTVKFKKGLL